MSEPTTTRPEARACCPANLPVPPAISEGAAVLAPLCKALGDPTRLQIAALLARAGNSLCACEIEAHFALSQPTISHHLTVLRKAGVVEGERRGTWIHYRLHPAALEAARGLIDLIAGPDCCRGDGTGRKEP